MSPGGTTEAPARPAAAAPAATATPPAGPAPVMALLPGLALCAALAAAAMWLADQPYVKQRLHFSALLIVVLIGMLVRSLAHTPAMLQPGIRMAQRPVLRWAVAGLGFRLSVGELWKIGGPALVVVVLSTSVALAFGWWLAKRLAIGEKLGLLLGVGGAICGASAVVAADTVVLGEKRDSALAIAVITLLGTIGIALYPVLGHALHMSVFRFGVWDGASLHELAQVVAAGSGLGDEAVRVATVVKLARICLLAPVVLLLSWRMRHAHRASGKAHVAIVPWFLVLFLVFAAMNSWNVLPAKWLAAITNGDLWLLCVGMAGVGLQTGFRDLRDAGWKPVLVGAGQWAVLSVVAYGLASWLCR